MHTQGCQNTRNFVRNSKILIARSSIQPKLSKIKNHWEMHQNSLKNGKLFLILLNDGWMVDLAMGSFGFITIFLIFWHPWDPWICIRSVCWKFNWNRFKQLLESSPAVHLVLLGRSLRSSKYFRFPAWISLSVIVCHFGFFDHIVVDPLSLIHISEPTRPY